MFARKPKEEANQTTQCRFCQQPFKHPPIGVPPHGEATPPARVVKLVMMLMAHLQTHPNEWARFQGAVQDFSALMIVNQFETDDPGLELRADLIRSDTHTRTRRHLLTDEDLNTLVYALFPAPTSEEDEDEPAAVRDQVLAILRNVREMYEEKGQYTPENQARRIIVPL